MSEAFENMDRMYRHQRYFYDLTRKYYLLGRDRLLCDLDVKTGENVLEIGCGTARNLIILAKKNPTANFYGLDASSEMLKTAQEKVNAAGFAENITLKTALADDFGYKETFGLLQPFDTIYFSYSITMIPTWKESILNALGNLKSDRAFYIVDFYDQADLPGWFRKLLQGWLRQFHVKYPKELLPFLIELKSQDAGKLTVTPLYKRYSFITRFEKS